MLGEDGVRVFVQRAQTSGLERDAAGREEVDRTTVGVLVRNLDPDVNRPPDPRRTAGYHYQSAYQS